MCYCCCLIFLSVRNSVGYFIWKKSHDRILFTWTAMCNHILSTIFNKKKLWNYAPNEKCREILSMTCAICMLLFKLFIIIGRHSRPEGATHIQSSCLAFSCLFHVARLKCVQMNTNSNRFNFCSFVFRWKKVYFIFQRFSSLLSLFYVVFFCCCIAFQIAVNKSCFAVHSNRHF